MEINRALHAIDANMTTLSHTDIYFMCVEFVDGRFVGTAPVVDEGEAYAAPRPRDVGGRRLVLQIRPRRRVGAGGGNQPVY